MEGNEEVNELENQDVETNEETPTPAPEAEVEETPEVTPEETPEAEAEAEPEVEQTPEPEATESETEETLSIEKAILEKFGNICETVEELVQMAKEGLENRNAVISQALESGVHSMGNAFDKEIFAKTFSNMQTKDIEQMGKTWEEQAQGKFSKEKISKQEVSDKTENNELRRIGLTQFKTGIY